MSDDLPEGAHLTFKQTLSEEELRQQRERDDQLRRLATRLGVQPLATIDGRFMAWTTSDGRDFYDFVELMHALLDRLDEFAAGE